MHFRRSRPDCPRIVQIVLSVFLPCALLIGAQPCLSLASLDRQSSSASAFSPRLGTFYYKIDWGGMPVGHAAMAVSREADHYRIALSSGTEKSVGRFFRASANGEGTLSQDDFSPLESVVKWRKGSDERTTSVFFGRDGEIETVEVERKDGRDPQKTVRSLQSDGGIFDLFSAVVLARTFDWRVGLTERFEVFTGRKTYRVTLECIGDEFYEEGGERIRAWVIAPSAVDPAAAADEPRLTSARIYLSADDSKDILKVRTKFGFGRLEARLKRFEPQTD